MFHKHDRFIKADERDKHPINIVKVHFPDMTPWYALLRLAKLIVYGSRL